MRNKILDVFFKDFSEIFFLLNKTLKTKTAWLFFLLVGQAASELLFIYALSLLTMAFADVDSLLNMFPFPQIMRASNSFALLADTPQYFILVSGVVVIFASAFKNLLSFVAARTTALLAENISIYIGTDIMSRYLYRDYSWHLGEESTKTYQSLLWRGNLAMLLIDCVSMYACVLTLCILLASLMGQEPMLTIIVGATVGSVGVLLYSFLRCSVDEQAVLVAESSQEETRAILYATKGIRDVIVCNNQPAFLKAMVDAAQKGVYPKSFNALAKSLPTWVLEFVGFVVVIFVISYLMFIEKADSQRIVSAVSILLLTSWRVLPYANRVVGYKVSVRSMRPTASLVIAMLKSLRANPSLPPPPPEKNFAVRQAISLRDVHYRYPDGYENSLQGVSFEISVGKTVGIIGMSGSGKSTLAGILSGLLQPTQGQLLVDGEPLSPSKAVAFSRLVGYVAQTPFLFTGTLAENVAFKDWGKKINIERVRKACRDAAIDFIDSHPKGFDLPILDNGVGLSGGQAQRVTIARALYDRPKVIIFDEATSSLDKKNESAIQTTIYSLARNVTCIIIAHRLETVEECDYIIWMERGRVFKVGTPDEILPEYRQCCVITSE